MDIVQIFPVHSFWSRTETTINNTCLEFNQRKLLGYILCVYFGFSLDLQNIDFYMVLTF